MALYDIVMWYYNKMSVFDIILKDLPSGYDSFMSAYLIIISGYDTLISW